MAAEKKLQCEVHDAGYSSYVSLPTPTSTAEDVLLAVETDSGRCGESPHKHCKSQPKPAAEESQRQGQSGHETNSVPVETPLVLTLINMNANLVKLLAASKEKTSEVPAVPGADICHTAIEGAVVDVVEPVKDGADATGSMKDKIESQCQDLWDVLPRLLRVVEVMSKHTDATLNFTPKSSLLSDSEEDLKTILSGDPFVDPFASPPSPDSTSFNEFCLNLSKSKFLSKLTDTELRLGIRPLKKVPKKVKGKADTPKGSVLTKFLTRELYKEVKSVFVVILLASLAWQLSALSGNASRWSNSNSARGIMGFW